MDGGACSVGALSGTYSGCSGSVGNCVVSKSYFETGTGVSYSTSDSLLWAVQHGGGALINMTNSNTNETFLVNGSGCIVFPDGTTQCSAGAGGANLSSVAFTNESNNFSKSQTFSENVTVAGSGFFGWLGGLGSRISKLFVVEVNATGDISTDGNVSADYFLGDGSLLSGVVGDNSSWNESHADSKYILQSGEGGLNVNSSGWWAGVSGWVSGWFVGEGGSLGFNESRLNETIDSRGTDYCSGGNCSGSLNVSGVLYVSNISDEDSIHFIVNGQSVLEVGDLENVTVYKDIVPSSDGVLNLGSNAFWFHAAYIEELFLNGNSLYM
ncbi:MAG: hypothetical protein MI892_11195, partial [Desulfobacterales bacterium]|nr:hypothetical protein [Desulfobacterales bacterium]